jgi:hypothetical protein
MLRRMETTTRGLALRVVFAIALALAAGCAPAGTRPHDMSTSGHEEAAASEETRASEARVTSGAPCGTPAARGIESPCWSSDLADQAAEHRDLAAAHRGAAAALREAEETACEGLADADRDASPFMHQDDIASVSELTVEEIVSRVTRDRVVGATIVFRAVPGLTAEWLQRVIDCHLARNASLGHDVPEMPYCPLVPRGVTARARSTGAGFAVDVRADSEEGIRQVVERARALARRAD